MQQLIATKAFPYLGRSLKVGDKFEASDRDAKVLKGGHSARDAEPEEPKSKRRYQRRDMVAED